VHQRVRPLIGAQIPRLHRSHRTQPLAKANDRSYQATVLTFSLVHKVYYEAVPRIFSLVTHRFSRLLDPNELTT
jgi:hypothetical protein